LQTLAFYNAVANGGKKIQPIIVKEIRKADQVLARYESQVLVEKICSDATLDKVKILLEGVVENGTARNIKSPLYKIAGKTGTAQKIINGAYSKTYSSSFCGYFPADRPKYSCIVIIDSPKSAKRYGGEIAAPVFKELADKIYSSDTDLHKSRVEPKPVEERSLPAIAAGNQDELFSLCKKLGISMHPTTEEEWVSVITSNLSYETTPRTVDNGTVPDVRGMTMRDALYLLENYGLKVRTTGSGRVTMQSVEPGLKVQRGTQINIILS
jgi:cell division protein FtsI (penicillin-binding protein 3)